MPNDDRRLPQHVLRARIRDEAAGAAPFCHVERRTAEESGSRHYVVHTASPRFVVEMERSTAAGAGAKPGVIRQVTVPNSWAGDYHRCARLLSAAVAFFEATADPPQSPFFVSIDLFYAATRISSTCSVSINRYFFHSGRDSA